MRRRWPPGRRLPTSGTAQDTRGEGAGAKKSGAAFAGWPRPSSGVGAAFFLLSAKPSQPPLRCASTLDLPPSLAPPPDGGFSMRLRGLVVWRSFGYGFDLFERVACPCSYLTTHRQGESDAAAHRTALIASRACCFYLRRRRDPIRPATPSNAKAPDRAVGTCRWSPAIERTTADGRHGPKRGGIGHCRSTSSVRSPYRVPDDFAGKNAKCRECGGPLAPESGNLGFGVALG